MKHLSIFPSAELIFPPGKCWNDSVGLEKQTEITVCDCIMLLVWMGSRAFPLPNSSEQGKTGGHWARRLDDSAHQTHVSWSEQTNTPPARQVSDSLKPQTVCVCVNYDLE